MRTRIPLEALGPAYRHAKESGKGLTGAKEILNGAGFYIDLPSLARLVSRKKTELDSLVGRNDREILLPVIGKRTEYVEPPGRPRALNLDTREVPINTRVLSAGFYANQS